MDMAPISASNTHCKSLVTLDLFPCEPHDPMGVCGPTGNKQPEEKTNLAWMRFMTDEEIKEEERHNVSTNLTLYTDPWTIKKEMTKTSLGYLNRLFLNGSTVRSHILRYLSVSDQRILEDGFGLSLEAYDDDTASMHNVVLKKWHKCESYVLLNGWRMDFVVRRALKEGDVIGMYWDPYGFKLHFRVLSRAPIRASSGYAAMGSTSFAPCFAGP
ncbi:PREDICTED: B3 domain-containing protein At2g33720-like [Camelina sativa]|uniref:B3 domain-containing protein At2g33720-like n=1 Tax=Camelina sativa TaxID=90675 RepID=A0ABM0ZB46_CAMSA|nr:PREDICTED: B3 domain-containing protein At2g33720-like [Camelina sativa]